MESSVTALSLPFRMLHSCRRRQRPICSLFIFVYISPETRPLYRDHETKMLFGIRNWEVGCTTRTNIDQPRNRMHVVDKEAAQETRRVSHPARRTAERIGGLPLPYKATVEF